MSVPGKYSAKKMEFLDRNGNGIENGGWSNNMKKEMVYTFDEALDLAGRGWYTYGLMAFIVLAFQGLALDMFGISVVLTGACDLNLSHYQKSVLLSMPLIGSITMAWPWGFIADTQGRRKALAFSLWGSFILSSLSAFSPNWIVLAVLKFGCCSLSSGTQSLGFTLLGESCGQRLRSPVMIIVTTSLISVYGVYTVIGYFVLNLDVSIDLGFITFSNWRLLILIFASPLGLSAALLGLIYESPKFLLSMEKEEKALNILKKISDINRGGDSSYPVKKIVLNETSTLRLKNIPLWQSIKDQTFPLFKPPYLWRTIQLFYITAAIYCSNNGFFVWLPFVVDTFYSGYNGNGTAGASVCDMIVNSNEMDTDTGTCVGTVKELALWMGVIQVLAYITINTGVSLLSRWKKSVMVTIMTMVVICGVLIPSVTNRIASIVLLNGFITNSLCIAIIFSYYVDIFPTSYRGMAACLGVMVARASSLVGINLVGSYIDSHCTTSFYAWSAYIISGVVVSLFLPSDNLKPQS
ncbi:synaptic vesicle 2-related protein-like [Bicyclus anynana]|uniref:Synaptic vesicle 2-related protein-like n=1 Tax=Bicyclus anynana TaxID=110368 RepID=A0A6J1NIY0_BICAN|nr:synaptic vesicle 2-related protein-like [Bicyclus anynana]